MFCPSQNALHSHVVMVYFLTSSGRPSLSTSSDSPLCHSLPLRHKASFVHRAPASGLVPGTWQVLKNICATSRYVDVALGPTHSPVSLSPTGQCSPSLYHQAQRGSEDRQGQAPSTVAASLSHRAQADYGQTQTWLPTERKRLISG